MTAIPPITDPLGRHWDQPPLCDILVDDTHAVMSPKTFGKLAAYDRSMPSGVYPGKMRSATMRDGTQYLRWYGDDGTPGMCTNNQRLVLLVEHLA